MTRLQQDWIALGPVAAQVVGLRLWWMAVWSVTSPQRALDEGWAMMAEKQAALVETQMRLAWLPWTIAMRALLAPVGPAAIEPMLSEALLQPSRRRVRANAARLRAVR